VLQRNSALEFHLETPLEQDARGHRPVLPLPTEDGDPDGLVDQITPVESPDVVLDPVASGLEDSLPVSAVSELSHDHEVPAVVAVGR